MKITLLLLFLKTITVTSASKQIINIKNRLIGPYVLAGDPKRNYFLDIYGVENNCLPNYGSKLYDNYAYLHVVYYFSLKKAYKSLCKQTTFIV